MWHYHASRELQSIQPAVVELYVVGNTNCKQTCKMTEGKLHCPGKRCRKKYRMLTA